LEANVFHIKTAFELFNTRIKPTLVRLPIDSQIVPAFASPFGPFWVTQFVLLWRGSRDGFDARDFHSRYDGHANTLTLILDTNGEFCGGFTLVQWEPSSWKSKCDNTLTSFHQWHLH
jgi:hypothetical protein